jgi:threonine dehydrogenase-like Zn-dependent dehydrogenase
VSGAVLDALVVRLLGPRRLELQRESLASQPQGARELVCETLLTAISPGTELAAYLGKAPLRDGSPYPRLQGYCNVARVLAAGSECAPFLPGDRILSFTSHRSHFAIDVSDVLARLPPEQKSADAAPAYLFHLGYDAVLRAGVRPGSRVLVVGLGAVGLGAVAMAGIAGARVFALSDQPAPARRAGLLGAGVFARAQSAQLALALTPALADVVIVTTDTWADWRCALDLAGHRASIACLGFPGRSQDPPDFNPLESRSFYAKQLRLEAVGLAPERADGRGYLRFNERDNLSFILELLRSGRLTAATLVSGSYPGVEIERAYADLAVRRDSPVTYLLEWHRE